MMGDENAFGRNAMATHSIADQDVKAPSGGTDKHEIPSLAKSTAPTESVPKHIRAPGSTDVVPLAPSRTSPSQKPVATLMPEQRPQKRMRKKTSAQSLVI